MTKEANGSERHDPTNDEDPFKLIQIGNAREAATNRWGAADSYSRASIALRRRADAISAQLRKDDDDMNTKSKGEKRKVISLYRGQSLEYLYKARHCLLQALAFENDQDRNRALEVAKSGSGNLDPLCCLISSEESERRSLTFQRLFLGKDDIPLESSKKHIHSATTRSVGSQTAAETSLLKLNAHENKTQDTQHNCQIGAQKLDATTEEPCKKIPKQSATSSTNPTDEIDGRTQSIESRLAELNSSLMSTNLPKVPPPFISGSRTSGQSDSQKRLEEIQRGLGRLGVSLPDNSKQSDLIPENLSTEDQVKLIIQQANDEVRVERGLNIDSGAESDGAGAIIGEMDEDNIDEDDSMFDGYEDEEDDIDALLLKAEKLVARTSATVQSPSESVSSSSELVQIRKAQALLLEARLCLEMEQTNNNNGVENVDADEASSTKAGNDGSNNPQEESKEMGNFNEECDKNDDVLEDKVDELKNINQSKSVASARKKARERIENAELCLKKMLNNWY